MYVTKDLYTKYIKNPDNPINVKSDKTKQKNDHFFYNGKILTDILPKICNWRVIIHKYTLHY